MKFIPVLVREDPYIDHKQAIFRFDNGYGASVIRGKYTYGGLDGLFELAVIIVEDDPKDKEGIDWYLTNVPSITGDNDNVLGYLSQERVEECLEMIEKLPPPKPALKRLV